GRMDGAAGDPGRGQGEVVPGRRDLDRRYVVGLGDHVDGAAHRARRNRSALAREHDLRDDRTRVVVPGRQRARAKWVSVAAVPSFREVHVQPWRVDVTEQLVLSHEL